MATPAARPGDVLIRHFAGASLQLLDAATHEQIAIVPSVDLAMRIAADRGGAVWRESVDNRGRALGTSTLLPLKHFQPPATAHITCLKALHDKWTRELQQLVTIDSERALHLTEALDDLAILIGRLEATD